jgi:hypothetical protein
METTARFLAEASNPVERVDRPLVLDFSVLRVVLDSISTPRPPARPPHVLDAFGDDEEFALAEADVPVPEFDGEAALDDEEHLFLCVMAVPQEFTLKLCELDVGIVEFPRDLWTPVLMKLRDFSRG